jgi:transposase
MASSSQSSVSPATVVEAGEGKRRRRSVAERRRIVEQTLVPGTSVARVARAHGVNANQVFYWRTLYRRGRLGAAVPGTGLLPVTVCDSAGNGAKVADPIRREYSPRKLSPALSPGVIHLDLPRAHLRIEGCVDPSALRAVLESLLR